MRDEELLDALGDVLRADSAPDPAPERIDALRREAVATAGRHEPIVDAPTVPTVASGRRPPRDPRLLALAAGVLVVVGAFGAWAWLGGDDGTVEYAGPVAGPGGEGDVTVTLTGIGRVVELDTDDLEILPTGEYYEVWFVGPTDSPDDPDRISAGTFHPDPEGVSRVTFAAAVDPALYPRLEITAEPGDGDPAATGPVVLEADLD